jgi:GTP-binding protein
MSSWSINACSEYRCRASRFDQLFRQVSPAVFSLSRRIPVPHAGRMSGLIAIVGRPNVGKSALFNQVVGRRIAIVHDEPGVTRDRVSAEAEWQGRTFTLVDTGGIGLLKGEKADDLLVRAALTQVELAIESADAIMLVVDGKEGVVPLDREVAGRLRRAGKPVIVAANKLDEGKLDTNALEFAELGFEQIHPISAIHDRGIEGLLQALLAHLPPPKEAGGRGRDPVKLSIVGRPNVGKSSLINALTRSERVIVSPIPGTTRDSVDVPVEFETDGVRDQYTLIVTAGIRKQRRVDNSIEFFSVKRAEDSIERSDIVLFILDAESGILEQDKKIADKIVGAAKACVLVVNKWDLFKETVEASRQEAFQRRGAGGRSGRPEGSLADFSA